MRPKRLRDYTTGIDIMQNPRRRNREMKGYPPPDTLIRIFRANR